MFSQKLLISKPNYSIQMSIAILGMFVLIWMHAFLMDISNPTMLAVFVFFTDNVVLASPHAVCLLTFEMETYSLETLILPMRILLLSEIWDWGSQYLGNGLDQFYVETCWYCLSSGNMVMTILYKNITKQWTSLPSINFKLFYFILYFILILILIFNTFLIISWQCLSNYIR